MGMSVLDLAHAHANKGHTVFPCNPANKAPLTSRGFKDASSNHRQIQDWWAQHPNAMIGMPCGQANDFWVVDCDGEEGKANFLALCQEHGYEPRTLCQATPSGGCHFLFAWPADRIIRNSASKLAKNVDVRGEGGYIIVAPSVNSTGGRYRWIGTASKASAPDWLLDMVCPPPAQPCAPQPMQATSNNNSNGRNAYAEAALADECAKVATACKGTRNDTLYKAANSLFQFVASGNLSEQEVQAGLERAAEACGLTADDGLQSVLKTIASGRDDGLAKPRQMPEPTHRPQSAEVKPMLTREEVSQQQEWPSPIPFDEFNLPQPDLANLPEVLRDFCQALSESLQVPAALPLSVSLASVATCVQGKFVTQVKPDYTEPVNIYMFCPLEPGNRKSGAVAACVAPINEHEARLREDFKEQCKREASERKTFEKAIESKRNKAANAKSPEELRQMAKEIADLEAELPDVQHMPRLMVDNVTPEALANLLQNNNERMGLIEAEGGIFDILSGMYNGGTPNLDLFLKGYSVEPARIDRKTSEPITLNHPCLSIGLSPQTFCLTNRKASEAFRGRGMDSRFLYLMPKSLLGNRKIETECIPEHIRQQYHSTLTRLLTLEPTSWPEDTIQPFCLQLSSDARKLWVDFAQYIEAQLGAGGHLEHMKDWGGKLPGNIVRIASLFHILSYDYPQTVDMDARSMEQAIALGHVFIEHARAAYALMGTDERLEAAKRILGWILRTRPQSFIERDCWRALRGTFKHMDAVRNGLAVLLERSYVFELASIPKVGVGRPLGQAYAVNPLVYD